MSYNAFLIAMSQMASKKKARVVVNDHLIFIEALNRKNRWKMFTKVFHSSGYIPPSVQDCLASAEFLRWQYQGAYLKLDPLTQSLYLVKEIEMPVGKYIPFRHHLNEFIVAADEWKETLECFAENDRVYTRACNYS